MADIDITRNDASQRYEARIGDTVVSVASFVDQGDRRLFPHTSTFGGYGGQGIATELVSHALRETIAEGKQIVPLCSFVRKLVTEPEFAPHIAA